MCVWIQFLITVLTGVVTNAEAAVVCYRKRVWIQFLFCYSVKCQHFSHPVQVGGVRVAVAIVVVVGVGLVRDVAPHDRVVTASGEGPADGKDQLLAECFQQQPSNGSALLTVWEVSSPRKSNRREWHPRVGMVVT